MRGTVGRIGASCGQGPTPAYYACLVSAVRCTPADPLVATLAYTSKRIASAVGKRAVLIAQSEGAAAMARLLGPGLQATEEWSVALEIANEELDRT